MFLLPRIVFFLNFLYKWLKQVSDLSDFLQTIFVFFVLKYENKHIFNSVKQHYINLISLSPSKGVFILITSCFTKTQIYEREESILLFFNL